MNYYETLGVGPDASQDEIRAAWRRLSMKHHPDRGGETQAMVSINEAYECLSDTSRRSVYDTEGFDPKKGLGLKQKAEIVLAQLLKKAMESTPHDAVAHAGAAMRDLLDDLAVQANSAERKIAKLRKQRERIARKDGKANLVQRLVDQQIASIEQQQATSAEQSEIFNACLSLLEAYEDTQAEPKPKPSYSSWQFTATHMHQPGINRAASTSAASEEAPSPTREHT